MRVAKTPIEGSGSVLVLRDRTSEWGQHDDANAMIMQYFVPR